MMKVFSTNVVISKRYDNNPALKFHNGEKGRVVKFRIGEKVYDPNAENNYRWVNLSVKAFNGMCDRIEKMKLGEGSYVNLVGTLDEETWTDGDGKTRSAMVIVLDDIEYAGSSKPKNTAENGTSQAGNTQPNFNHPAQGTTPSDNFTGYQNFGGAGGMFDEN